MVVVLGLPLKLAITRLGDIFSMLNKFSIAFGENRMPTPPTDELAEFFSHEAVTR